ncbi:hypothetical protein LSH36_253g02073 [Paralvinella palmiformis]|uniref:Uncharacterized protein n=1 Tax=Paralvinella palmiformis TaxID=53620 RepID=A0AAD9JKW2_9ANNE|nr:hypothetical protein LSH36_253g02073 [Paralvinella palmiformis]
MEGLILPYASGILAAEIILLFLLLGLEVLRIFFGRKGNLTERVISVVVSLVLTIPSVFGSIYILIWQTYVLRAEVILVAIELTFLALELIFAIVSIITFARIIVNNTGDLMSMRPDVYLTLSSNPVDSTLRCKHPSGGIEYRNIPSVTILLGI